MLFVFFMASYFYNSLSDGGPLGVNPNKATMEDWAVALAVVLFSSLGTGFLASLPIIALLACIWLLVIAVRQHREKKNFVIFGRSVPRLAPLHVIIFVISLSIFAAAGVVSNPEYFHQFPVDANNGAVPLLLSLDSLLLSICFYLSIPAIILSSIISFILVRTLNKFVIKSNKST